MVDAVERGGRAAGPTGLGGAEGALVAGALVRSLGAPRVLGAFSAGLALLALGNLAWNARVREL